MRPNLLPRGLLPWKKDSKQGRKIGLASRLMVSTTFNFFIALVVFIIASHLLIPHMLKQEVELQALRQEVDALNQRLKASEASQQDVRVEATQAESGTSVGVDEGGTVGDDGTETASDSVDNQDNQEDTHQASHDGE